MKWKDLPTTLKTIAVVVALLLLAALAKFLGVDIPTLPDDGPSPTPSATVTAEPSASPIPSVSALPQPSTAPSITATQ